MTRNVLTGLTLACACAVGTAAQSQTPATSQAAGQPVVFAGCVERDSAGPTGSGSIGNPAGNPVTTQNALKLTHVDWMAATRPPDRKGEKDEGKDVRLLAKDKDLDLHKHIGEKVEVTGLWSNSPDTQGTVGVGGTGAGGSGTGGSQLNPRSGANMPTTSGPRDSVRHLFVVSSVKTLAASCDGK